MAKTGRPTIASTGIMLRMPDSVIEKIDSFRKEEADLPTRPEMIRRIIAEWIDQKENMK
jgi:metal-responsive CopG/Arc/MetJ family transcriptional regulator